jgi:hypothetical protein
MNLSQGSIGEHEVLIDEWPSFIEAFVGEHKRLPAMIEIFSASGRLIEARRGLLRSLTLDSKRHVQRAFVELEEPVRGDITHVIAYPVRIAIRQAEAQRELEITSAGGRRTVITLGSVLTQDSLV